MLCQQALSAHVLPAIVIKAHLPDGFELLSLPTVHGAIANRRRYRDISVGPAEEEADGQRLPDATEDPCRNVRRLALWREVDDPALAGV